MAYDLRRELQTRIRKAAIDGAAEPGRRDQIADEVADIVMRMIAKNFVDGVASVDERMGRIAELEADLMAARARNKTLFEERDALAAQLEARSARGN